jgi:hypothetical protein
MRKHRLTGCGVGALIAAAGAARGQIVHDGSFEAGSPSPVWTEFSTNFGTPLCNGDCFGAGQATAARTGVWWAWFGGIDSAFEEGSVSQAVTIPPGTATLQFYLEGASQRTDGQDVLQVFVDSTSVYSINDQELGPYGLDYVLVNVDLSSFAGGGHTIKFDSMTHGSAANPLLTNFFVDDVSIVVSSPPSCYANCDGSTTVPFLNISDFVCFQGEFAAGSSLANCDGSTTPPVLNISDFICFQSRFAAGCSAP